ncbi:MDR family MFS transporter [Paenibacillus phoenicis]|uniref:MDR family MFS transporter n=1 Tax=Paenibacillus phoenicis TaxID=554117 RepID=UPI003D2DC803
MNTQKSSRLGFVVAGLLLGILMSAMDNTIVSTAMATIVSELGGLDKYVWVTSAYMVAEMAAMPIFGKLSDMYGRKRFFVFGIALFLLGSILCGTADTIVQLSIYRAIQGIGGGALMPIAFAIVFDVFPVEKRGAMGGLFGAVFGISSLAGPLLGAFITDHLNWRWNFYINIPIGILALFLILAFYRESAVHSKQRIDWWGAVTLIGAVVALMFALELGGQLYAWDSGQILGLFAAFAVLFTIFLLVERKAEEPIVSFAMFRKRLFASSNLAGLFYGAAFIAASVYIPLFVQGVTGGTATNSGLILLPMTLSSVVASQVGGFLVQRTSFRNVMILSAVIFIVGIALLATITPDTTKTLLSIYMATAGFGVGFSFSVLGMSAIQDFGPSQRGAASSTMSFIRSLGMTVGITIFGIVQRNLFANRLSESLSAMGGGADGLPSMDDPRTLLASEARKAIPAPVLEQIVADLSKSITTMFWWTLVPAVLALITVCFMGNAKMRAYGAEAAGRNEAKPAVSE